VAGMSHYGSSDRSRLGGGSGDGGGAHGYTPYGHGSGHGGGGGSFGMSMGGAPQGAALPRPDFSNLPAFEKNFYLEHPSVTALSDEEVASYRARRDM